MGFEAAPGRWISPGIMLTRSRCDIKQLTAADAEVRERERAARLGGTGGEPGAAAAPPPESPPAGAAGGDGAARAGSAPEEPDADIAAALAALDVDWGGGSAQRDSGRSGAGAHGAAAEGQEAGARRRAAEAGAGRAAGGAPPPSPPLVLSGHAASLTPYQLDTSRPSPSLPALTAGARAAGGGKRKGKRHTDEELAVRGAPRGMAARGPAAARRRPPQCCDQRCDQ